MNWLTQLFSRRRLYNDLSEEIRSHIEEKIDELVAVGRIAVGLDTPTGAHTFNIVATDALGEWPNKELT